MTAGIGKDRAAIQSALHARIERQVGLRRREPDKPRIKVNLYTADEVRGVARAAERVAAAGEPDRIDCLMVADSYLMTHLGRPSTRLPGAADRAAFLDRMVALVREVAEAAHAAFPAAGQPWILADMPDGSIATTDAAHRNIERMLEAGADCVKLELGDPGGFAVLEQAASRGLPTVAHLGYQPQFSENRRYGVTRAEAETLFAQARRARDSGAVALVLERVSEIVNASLCAPSRRSLPVYSIFSGRARWGGQSLNVWDSVFRPAFRATHFPPTATLGRDTYPEGYNVDVIADHFAELLTLAYAGLFPAPAAVPSASRDGVIPPRDLDPWNISPLRPSLDALG